MRLVDDMEYRAGIDVSTLDVLLRNGRVLVRGTVSDSDEVVAIRESLEDEQGIDQVDLQVQISPVRREEERDLAREVVEAFEKEGRLAEENIQVACAGGVLVLRGVVQEAAHKHVAGLLAMRIAGLDRLRNRLLVRTG